MGDFVAAKSQLSSNNVLDSRSLPIPSSGPTCSWTSHHCNDFTAKLFDFADRTKTYISRLGNFNHLQGQYSTLEK